MSFEGFKKAEMEGWDARAGFYDEFTGRFTTVAIPMLLAMAETAPGSRLLDVCCGTGRAAGAAAALGARAEGIDVAPAMVEAARAAFPAATFELGDVEAIPRADDTYDAVIWSFGLMHVGSPEAVLGEIARVLKPGGRVALSHWIGPPGSPMFNIVFGAMKRLADMSVVPPSPPPFALSTEDAIKSALDHAGFDEVSCRRLPIVFRCPAGRFAEHFRNFAARSAVILDRQDEAIQEAIHADWDSQLQAFLVEGELQVPMPALAVAAVRRK